ncbi:carbohydrate ABC transporter substrate-binding protein (CUT1 family) [Aliiruegeria haliotis]|uniref:Carbohydrate ABC transporter substrate-binding protein (CUT1 family) n=1 Tax=Aliiruegeria haliotis TaxID=1280846 RepID=A0A2T0S0L6_9RHOB|nr:ABC transporter substrate-binding protein [Aliiruegeria haliotis]PRY26955.1 carbohydrate ABC transporter substrate-binding protein (CUT1 family) [Aliiruegeria haliotis]
MRKYLLGAVAFPAIVAMQSAYADEMAAQKWIDEEFQPSVLSKEEQLEEMKWFISAAEPFSGMEINVLSEGIPTHSYESEVLTKAFEEITGIKVNHQILGEGEVVQAVQTQMQTKRNLYDAYVNDSDLIGTHSRLQLAYNLTDWMAGAGADVTNPGLDLDDFMGIQFTTGPDGDLYQLPDQQFANLYWFRKDWFDREDLQAAFKEKYGYDLGVPVNWSAYEDIAQFFSEDVKEIDGTRIYGHMDYGKRAPDLGWRMTDAWLSMAGAGSKGEPNGVPIDEWGIRMEAGSCNPAGASVSRGGATNGPAAVYAIRKWDEWLRAYAPPGAASYDFYQSLPALSQGNVAQQIFWYTAFTADMVAPKSAGNNTVDDEGTPLWRMAPSPHGPYWEEGQKVGYQDVGSWTILNSTPEDRAKAAWLYAQFVVSKTVDVKKSHVGLTFIRDSSVRHESFTERAPKLGGLVEFYRSPDRVAWSPTGINVPDYPKLAQLWWQQIGDVNSGAFTPQEAMDRLAGEMDQVMARMQAADEQADVYGGCGPRLNEEMDPSEWLGKPDGPKAKLDNEKPQGETVNYDELVARWASQ